MEYRFNFYPWQWVTGKVTVAHKLDSSFDSKRLSLETEQLLSEFGSFRQHDVYHSGGWSAICLHALDGRVDADWGGVGVYKKTPALLKAPYIESVIDSFKCEKKRVRLLGLMPGEDIYWHYDENESFDSGTVRLHIPVITNENVALQICHQTLRWKEGELWYGDFSFPHRVRNLGQKTRIHLVLDLVVNEWLESQFPSALFEEQYERALARKKCESLYKIYDLQFLIKRYSRSIANNPARVLPKVLELVGLKKPSR